MCVCVCMCVWARARVCASLGVMLTMCFIRQIAVEACDIIHQCSTVRCSCGYSANYESAINKQHDVTKLNDYPKDRIHLKMVDRLN